MKLIAIIVVIVMHATALSARGENISTTVQIEVRGPAGELLQDVPVQCVGVFEFPLAFSDETGVARFEILRERRAGRICWALSDGFLAPVAAEIGAHANARYRQLCDQFAFPAAQVAALAPDATEIQLSLVATHAVRVRGVLRDHAGAPVKGGGVLVAKTHSLAISAADGTFECRGIPKGKAGTLLVMGKGTRVWFFHLTAAQLAAHLDLGDLSLAAVPDTASVRMSWPGHRRMTSAEMDPVGDEMTLIRADGTVMYSFDVSPQDGSIGGGDTTVLPGKVEKICPGVYYAAPGIAGCAPSLKLLELIRSGRIAEIDATSVPKQTMIADQSIDWTIDLAAALAAIEGIPVQPSVVNPPPPEVPPGP